MLNNELAGIKIGINTTNNSINAMKDSMDMHLKTITDCLDTRLKTFTDSLDTRLKTFTDTMNTHLKITTVVLIIVVILIYSFCLLHPPSIKGLAQLQTKTTIKEKKHQIQLLLACSRIIIIILW